MKKLYNSDFETLDNIIKTIDFNYNPDETQKFEEIKKCWHECIGEDISKLTRVLKISKGVLTITCADSYTANELYFVKDKLLKIFVEKTEKTGIKVKEIRFEYKKWKEKDDEKI